MKRGLLFILVPLLMAGCGLVEPKDSEPHPNDPPTTILTTSPLEGSETSYLAPVAWRGEDSDGVVVGYYVIVDGAEWFTASTESIFAFTATSGEGDSLHDYHTIAVASVDDDGDRDDSPPSVSFNSYTYLPETGVSGVEAGAEVGQAVTFYLSADDPDDYVFTYSYGIDGEWIDQDDDGEADWFGPADDEYEAIFADPAIVSGAHEPLTVGEHTFSVRARDRALGIDPSPASVTFMVLEGTEPETQIISGEAADEELFIDWSGYSASSGINRVRLTVEGDASAYTGTVHSFSYSLDGGTYSPWATSVDILMTGVAAGSHPFAVKARDTAGNEDSTPAEITFNLVLPDLGGGLVLVHETVDGRGVPGSPTAQEVEDFYADALGSTPFVVEYWDTLGQITPGMAAGNASTVLWVTDDYGEDDNNMPAATGFLSQYLDIRDTYGVAAKPALLVSALDLLVNIAGGGTIDSVTFSEGDFVYDYWGIQSAVTVGTSAELYTAVAEVDGYPDIQVDDSKVLASWRGKLKYIWTLALDAQSEVLYTLASDDGTSEFEGAPCALLRRTDEANIIVLCFPLYFMDEAAVPQFLEKALSDLAS